MNAVATISIMLRIIACSLLASGGYEYIKTVTRAFLGEGAEK